VRSRGRRAPSRVPAEDPDFNSALEAMTAPELRALVRGVLDEVAPDARTAIVDQLMARAVKGRAGWKPSSPSQRIVDNARSFAEAARVVGYADPADVSEHLRLGSKAFLAGDHASARGVFEALLPPIAVVDIDLGQHELVDEVLGVEANTCVAKYVTSVFTTTPLGQRADALLRRHGASERRQLAAESDQRDGGRLSWGPAGPQYVPSDVGEAPRTLPAVEGRMGERARTLAS